MSGSLKSTPAQSQEVPLIQPHALEQTTELDTSIGPSILGCGRDPSGGPSVKEPGDSKQNARPRHLSPAFFAEPGWGDCKADDGNFG